MTILEKLHELLANDDIAGEIDSSDGTETLRIAPDRMGPDNDGVVVMEICRVPIDDDEGCGYYQLYTTIFKELETERYPEMLVALNEINLSTVLGNYGILATHQMLYHKYVMRLPSCADGDTVKALQGTVYDILGIIDNDMLELAKAID